MNNADEANKSRLPTKGNIVKSMQGQLKDLTMAELLKYLQTSQDGLSKAEVQKRLESNGYNELPEKRSSQVLKFLSYFWGPSP